MEVTIEITQFCENECDFCSSNASKEGKHLPFDKIAEFVDSIGNIDRINISGGEPISHPRFYDILKLCKSKTDNVWVYTNALDKIIFNSHVLKEIKVEANVCVIPGREVYIPEKAERVHLLKLIHHGRAQNFPDIDVTASRNFFEECHKACDHLVLQADGEYVVGPCKKRYAQR